jgi:hypothetical protein
MDEFKQVILRLANDELQKQLNKERAAQQDLIRKQRDMAIAKKMAEENKTEEPAGESGWARGNAPQPGSAKKEESRPQQAA